MQSNKGKKVLSKIKRTFLRMTSPSEFGGTEIRFNHELSLNIPPAIARGDAAYKRAAALIQRNNIISFPLDTRIKYYRLIELLLTDTAAQYENASNIAAALKIDMDFESSFKLFAFLAEKISLLLEIALSQETMFSADDAFSQKFGSEATELLQNSDTVFAEHEVALSRFLTKLIASMDSRIENIRSQNLSLMAKADAERYIKAYTEFSSIFSGEKEDSEFKIS